MKYIEHSFQLNIGYPLSRIDSADRILFFDIETTGLSPHTSQLYLIGAVTCQNDGWHYHQWFAESLKDELPVLRAFFAFSASYRTLVHFNGDHFDIRYLEEAAGQYGIFCPLSSMQSFDILKKIRAHRKLFPIDNLKQKTVEQFLGLGREDTYTGGELISVYEHYSVTKDPEALRFLLLHNEEDLKGMPKILPILNYADALDPELIGKPVEAWQNKSGSEATVVLEYPCVFPTPFTVTLTDELRVSFTKDQAVCTIRLYNGSLRIYYPNCKDYYYLPKEDMAIHKKLAAFVDKEFRRPATKETCYARLPFQTDEQFLKDCLKNMFSGLHETR